MGQILSATQMLAFSQFPCSTLFQEKQAFRHVSPEPSCENVGPIFLKVCFFGRFFGPHNDWFLLLVRMSIISLSSSACKNVTKKSIIDIPGSKLTGTAFSLKSGSGSWNLSRSTTPYHGPLKKAAYASLSKSETSSSVSIDTSTSDPMSELFAIENTQRNKNDVIF